MSGKQINDSGIVAAAEEARFSREGAKKGLIAFEREVAGCSEKEAEYARLGWGTMR